MIYQNLSAIPIISLCKGNLRKRKIICMNCRLSNGALLQVVNTIVFIAEALSRDNSKDGPGKIAPDVTSLLHIHTLKG